MSCYSLDFRNQVIKIYEGTGDIKKILEEYNISRRTLFYWIKKKEEGNLKPKARASGKPYKIDVNKLNELDKDSKEDYTLKEVSDILNVTLQAVYYYFVKNRITFKKKRYGITNEI